MGRSAVEIVRAYGVDAWTQGRDDLIPELCHDPIIRHDADREVRLSHAEQRARMRHNYEELRPVFEDVVLAGDDEYVTLVWNVTGRDPNWKWSGIEVFRVVDGRIAEVWNSSYQDGHWGLSKSLVGSVAGGAPMALPLMRADLSGRGDRVSGKLLVPADPQGLAAWFSQLFGAPAVERDGDLVRRRFVPGGVSAPLSLTVADKSGPSVGLANIAIQALTIEWERSGLINAAIELAADAAAPLHPSLPPATAIRLSETIGSFERGAWPRGRRRDRHRPRRQRQRPRGAAARRSRGGDR